MSKYPQVEFFINPDTPDQKDPYTYTGTVGYHVKAGIWKHFDITYKYKGKLGSLLPLNGWNRFHGIQILAVEEERAQHRYATLPYKTQRKLMHEFESPDYGEFVTTLAYKVREYHERRTNRFQTTTPSGEITFIGKALTQCYRYYRRGYDKPDMFEFKYALYSVEEISSITGTYVNCSKWLGSTDIEPKILMVINWVGIPPHDDPCQNIILAANAKDLFAFLVSSKYDATFSQDLACDILHKAGLPYDFTCLSRRNKLDIVVETSRVYTSCQGGLDITVVSMPNDKYLVIRRGGKKCKYEELEVSGTAGLQNMLGDSNAAKSIYYDVGLTTVKVV